MRILYKLLCYVGFHSLTFTPWVYGRDESGKLLSIKYKIICDRCGHISEDKELDVNEKELFSFNTDGITHRVKL